MICLFGGTFDPVHLGHLHAANAVCDALAIDQIHLVLSARPSHKASTGASIEARWEMLCLACEDHKRLIPDDREIRRQSPSYTVDTLEELRRCHPDQVLSWVIGSDAYALLPEWYRWRRVLELANLVVLRRPGHALALDETMAALTRERQVSALSAAFGQVLLLDAPMQDVAAETIRRKLAAGEPAGHLLPAAVAAYIRRHGLYQVI